MLEILLLVGSVHLIGLISPGPDFALILRNSIMHHTGAALWSAFGIALGVLVHLTYTLTGLSVLLTAFPQATKIIGLFGAMYLFWIGASALRSTAGRSETKLQPIKKDLGAYKALSMGFMVNVANPKCLIYFVSFLSTIIATNHDRLTSILIGAEIFLLTWLWFSFLSLVLGHKQLQNKIQQYRYIMDKTVGILFLGFGISMGVFIWSH